MSYGLFTTQIVIFLLLCYLLKHTDMYSTAVLALYLGQDFYDPPLGIHNNGMLVNGALRRDHTHFHIRIQALVVLRPPCSILEGRVLWRVWRRAKSTV